METGKSRVITGHELLHPHPHLHCATSSLCRYAPQTKAAVSALGKCLVQTKGSGSVKSQAALKLHEDVILDASGVLVPLMPFLEDHMSIYERLCEASIRRRLLKRLWRTVIRLIEEVCLLPPQAAKNFISETGSAITEVSRLFNYKEDKLVVEEVSDGWEVGAHLAIRGN